MCDKECKSKVNGPGRLTGRFIVVKVDACDSGHVEIQTIGQKLVDECISGFLEILNFQLKQRKGKLKLNCSIFKLYL